jgi:hypothetical protein
VLSVGACCVNGSPDEGEHDSAVTSRAVMAKYAQAEGHEEVCTSKWSGWGQMSAW